MSDDLTAEQARGLRKAYDALSPDKKAALARCPDAVALMMDRTFWELAGSASDEVRLRLAHVVVCFPAAEQLAEPNGFKVGAFLRKALYPGQPSVDLSQAMRYRQLVQARDVDQLVHRLRRILQESRQPVDWGVLGRDMFNWSDRVRKQWERDFIAGEATPGT